LLQEGEQRTGIWYTNQDKVAKILKILKLNKEDAISARQTTTLHCQEEVKNEGRKNNEKWERKMMKVSRNELPYTDIMNLSWNSTSTNEKKMTQSKKKKLIRKILLIHYYSEIQVRRNIIKWYAKELYLDSGDTTYWKADEDKAEDSYKEKLKDNC